MSSLLTAYTIFFMLGISVYVLKNYFKLGFYLISLIPNLNIFYLSLVLLDLVTRLENFGNFLRALSESLVFF